jgi:hypothetical protein
LIIRRMPRDRSRRHHSLGQVRSRTLRATGRPETEHKSCYAPVRATTQSNGRVAPRGKPCRRRPKSQSREDVSMVL